MAWVYILRGVRYYIGSTENLERRIAEHQRGNNHTTHRFGGETSLIAATEEQASHAGNFSSDLIEKLTSRRRSRRANRARDHRRCAGRRLVAG